MALTNSFPTGLPAGLSIIDTRKTLAELIVCSSTGVPRLGVLPRNFDPIVTATASMSYAIAGADFVTSRTGQGIELVTNDGAVTVATTAAPGSNSRLDVIWVRSRFTASADALGTPEFNVTQGAVSGTVPPPKPSIPAGAVEIATAQIPAGASATNSAGVIITQSAQFTAAQGGLLPLRSTAELSAVAVDSRMVYVLQTKQTLQYLATATKPGWFHVSGPPETSTAVAYQPLYRAAPAPNQPLTMSRQNGRVFLDGGATTAQSVTFGAGYTYLLGTISDADWRPAFATYGVVRFGGTTGVVSIDTSGAINFAPGVSVTHAENALVFPFTGISWPDKRM